MKSFKYKFPGRHWLIQWCAPSLFHFYIFRSSISIASCRTSLLLVWVEKVLHRFEIHISLQSCKSWRQSFSFLNSYLSAYRSIWCWHLDKSKFAPTWRRRRRIYSTWKRRNQKRLVCMYVHTVASSSHEHSFQPTLFFSRPISRFNLVRILEEKNLLIQDRAFSSSFEDTATSLDRPRSSAEGFDFNAMVITMVTNAPIGYTTQYDMT